MVTVYIITDKNSEFKFYTTEALNEFLKERPDLSDRVIQSEEEEQKPVISVPQSVPLWCLRTILKVMGLFDTVKATIEGMEDSELKIAAFEGLEYANTVLRNSPTTLFIQSILQLTDEQVDDIFINANAVEA